MTTLAAVKVSKAFPGIVAVNDVSFELERGESLAVIGPNGAGKSTLFGCVAGEHRVSEGRVLLGHKEITNLRPSQLSSLGVARTFQVARIFMEESVLDNVVLAADARRRIAMRPWNSFRARTSASAQAMRILQDVGLGDQGGRIASVLSHGDKKRLELAMALAQDPVVLLLDEPTAGMSSSDMSATMSLLRSVRQAHSDLSLLITAHDMEFVFGLADRVLLMAEGRLELSGTPDEVAANSRTREIYLGAEWSERGAGHA
jgi:branched-chain amino acid transport system ATP-binding protein